MNIENIVHNDDLYGGYFCDYQSERHPLFNRKGTSECYKLLFSERNIKKISSAVTNLTRGLDKYGRDIVVPDRTICNVLDKVFNEKDFALGDIYSIYNIPSPMTEISPYQQYIDQTIGIIVDQIKTTIKIESCNSDLNKWDTVLGDFNRKGLQSHSKIKLKNKRVAPMQFNMNY